MDHWPSRHHEPAFRAKAADVARKRLDEILAADPKADIVMLGDFNDEPSDTRIKDHLRAATSAEESSSRHDASTRPPTSKPRAKALLSTRTSGTRSITSSFRPACSIPTGYRWKEGAARPSSIRELFYQPQISRRAATAPTSYTKDQFHKNGYSDHLPADCVIVAVAVR